MKAIVDPNLCVGCGICEQLCDTVFEMNDGMAKVRGTEVLPEEEASCKEAADACPVDAITIAE